MPEARPFLLALVLATTAFTGCLGKAADPAPEGPGATEPSSLAEDDPGEGAANATAVPVPEEPPAPRFVFEGFEAEPLEVGVGDSVTVTATVVNAGTDAGTIFILPLWDGVEQPGVLEFDMVKGRKKEVTFTFKADRPGAHEVGLQIVGFERKTAPVQVLGPDPRIASWVVDNPYCKQYVNVTVTMENRGGTEASGYHLDVYSVNEKGATMGSAGFGIDGLAPRAKRDLVADVFAPQECGVDTTYTLLFIMSKDGVELWRETTEPFDPVTFG